MSDEKKEYDIHIFATPSAKMNLKKPTAQQIIENQEQQQKFIEAIRKKYSRGKDYREDPKEMERTRIRMETYAKRHEMECQAQIDYVKSIVKQLKRPY